MDEAVIPGISAAKKYYNRDLKRDSSSSTDYLYGYAPGNSHFKICDVGTVVGAKDNLWEAKDAGVDCKDMNLYKCISFCVIEETCRSAFFYEGPMEGSLEEPAHFCVQLLHDFDLEGDGDPAKFEDKFWEDLAKIKCEDTCTPCTYTSTSGISACTLKKYLEDNGDAEESQLMPLMKKTGSKMVFMDHIGNTDEQGVALKNIESK